MIRLLCLYALGIYMLGGCALQDKVQRGQSYANAVHENLSMQHMSFFDQATNTDSRRRMRRVNRPWVAGNSQPLAREVKLPLALRANVLTTLLFDNGPADLSELAQRITAVTEIPVHVSPEALLPSHEFLPRLSIQQSIISSSGARRIYLSGDAEPLAKTLDRVAAALSVYWQFRNNKIEFFRTQTKVFDVQALTLEARSEASIGQGSANQSDGAFTSTSQTRLISSSNDVLDVIKARIEPFMTRAGTLVAQPGASSSIVVTDTPDSLDSIASYLERENRLLSKRIRLIFEEITISTSDDSYGSIDWNLVFTSARIAASAASVNGMDVAGVSASALGVQQGPYKGSEAIVSALSNIGKVVRRTSVPVLTLNRKPVTHAVRTTFSYIDKVDTTAAYSDGTGFALPSVSVSQKEETVGSLLTLVPDAQDDGRIMLSLAYDNTVAQPIKSVRFGDRSNPLQLQQVTIDGNGTVQQLVLQPGQPILISGFERRNDESSSKRLLDGLPIIFGGANNSKQEHLLTVIVLTAHVEEGV